MINVELFCCSGGMAEGFRRAGVDFDLAFDADADACESYERNLGRRPVRMDVADLLRMSVAGWRPPGGGVRLLVADPPCTPWSRAGKRRGLEDERDMLRETAFLIRVLKPEAYLIGNVPGLQDATSWGVVQDVIGGLAADGYCVVDYAALDAADYGVPQRRVRPFWYGHLRGPCVRWPTPTHQDPRRASPQISLLGDAPLLPWVTVRQALAGLPPEEMGRPVVLRRRDPKHPPSDLDGAAMTVRTGDRGNAGPHVELTRLPEVTENVRHPPLTPDAVSPTIGAKDRCQGGNILSLSLDAPRPPRRRMARVPQSERGIHPDAPAPTVTSKEDRAGNSSPTVLVLEQAPARKRAGSTQGEQWSRVADPDRPSPAVMADTDRSTGSGVKVDPRILAERAPDPNRPPADPDAPHRAVVAAGRGHNALLQWPWDDRPSVTILAGNGSGVQAAPGKGSLFAGPRGANAIVLSERAAARLQSFPDGWAFAGKSKRRRWSQLGQAMPPPLAEAVARAVREQMAAADAPPKGCNRHDDCAAAEARWLKGRPRHELPAGFHCRDETCEDCFGS